MCWEDEYVFCYLSCVSLSSQCSQMPRGRGALTGMNRGTTTSSPRSTAVSVTIIMCVLTALLY